MLIWDKISSVFDSMPWVVISVGAGAFIGWMLPFNGRMFLFYVTVAIGVIWFFRLYRKGNKDAFVIQEQKAALPIAPVVSAFQERSGKNNVDELVMPLSPNEAREWLDDFLVRQQGQRKNG
jgi:hypothetical protein